MSLWLSSSAALSMRPPTCPIPSAQRGTDGMRLVLQTSFYRIIDRFIDQGGTDTDSVFGGTFKDDPGAPANCIPTNISEEKLTALHAVHCASMTARLEGCCAACYS